MKLDPVAKKGEVTSLKGVKKIIFKVPFRAFFKGLDFTQISRMLINPAWEGAVIGHEVACHFYYLSACHW